MSEHIYTGQAQHLALNQKRGNASKKDIDGVGRLALSIPHQHYPGLQWPRCLCEKCLYKVHPELDQKDQQLQAAAWLRFIKSPESIPYRVGKA